jgi:5-(hydroxymethyl)furfural/furfural oxidase
MGAANDPDAVVDPAGRVRGFEGLRIADASVMPKVPRGNTNIPTIMVAEKLAAAIDP